MRARAWRWCRAALLVVVVVVAGLGVVGTAGAADTTAPDCSSVSFSGSGTEGNPWKVSDVDELQCVGNSNAGTDLGDNFTLTSDIDASGTDQWNDGAGFDPIGDSTTPFTGAFDGTGAVVSGLSIDRDPADKDGVGLFGNTTSDATVERVRLEDVDVNGGSSNRVGALVGSNGAQ
jgi:hypothetical protein